MRPSPGPAPTTCLPRPTEPSRSAWTTSSGSRSAPTSPAAMPSGSELLTRAHREALRASDVDRAARCAFWLGFGLLFRNEPVRGGGWLARAAQHAEEAGKDSVVHGYLRVPAALQRRGGRRASRPRTAAFNEAARIAGLHADADLTTIARLGLGDDPDRSRPGHARRRHARRGDGRGDGRRGVADGHGDRLLRHDRGLRADLRPRSRARMDRGPVGLVRGPSGPRPVSGDHASSTAPT